MNLKSILKFLSDYLGSLSKLSLLLGGVVFLFYCIHIKSFPDNLTAGDGVWLLFISAIYSMWTIIFYSFLACLGVSIIMLWRAFYSTRIGGLSVFLFKKIHGKVRFNRSEQIDNKKKRKDGIKFNLTFPKIQAPVHYLSGVGFFILACSMVLKGQYLWLGKFLLVALLFGLVIIMLVSNRQQYRQLELIDIKDKSEIKKNIQLATVLFICGAMFVSTFLIGLFQITSKMTMSALGIRKEDVTLYIKKPWSDILHLHGIEGSEVAFSQDYKKYDHMRVGLSNFGTSVIIEFGPRGEPETLKVPGDSLLIDTLPELKAINGSVKAREISDAERHP